MMACDTVVAIDKFGTARAFSQGQCGEENKGGGRGKQPVDVRNRLSVRDEISIQLDAIATVFLGAVQGLIGTREQGFISVVRLV